MRNKLLLFIILSCIFQVSFCQNKTFVGISSSFNIDLNEISDETNCVSTTPLNNVSIGLNLSHEINNCFIMETGLIYKTYKNGFEFNAPVKVFSFSTCFAAMNTWQIPLRIKLKTNIGRNVSFNVSLGYNYCYSNSTGASEGYFYSYSQTDTITINFSSKLDKPISFSLLESSLGLEFNIIKGTRILISGSYYTSFKKINSMDINYKNNNTQIKHAKAQLNGDYWCVGVSFYYPLVLFNKHEKTKLLSK